MSNRLCPHAAQFVLIAAALSSCNTSPPAAWPGHTPPDQWSEPRIDHEPFDAKAWGDRIVLQEKPPRFDPDTRILSPNGAYGYAMSPSAHPRSNNPVDVAIEVYNERARVPVLTLRGCDTRYGPYIEWTNEKLVYVRVWWGRVVGADLILDAETGEMIYLETVRDGGVPFQQWNSAP